MQAMKWDDLKILLAINRSGTLSAAALSLGVNQTTVARRLDASEKRLNARLFDRVDGHLIPTPQGQHMLVHAELAEQEILAAINVAQDAESHESGLVRITSVEGILSGIIAPRLVEFNAHYPLIELELISQDANLSLSRREADIALRVNRPVDGNAITRKVAMMGFDLYAAKSGNSEAWLCYDETMEHLPEAKAAQKLMGNKKPVLRTNSMTGLRMAVASGLGKAILPCYMADKDPNLMRLSPSAVPIVSRELWLLVHRAIRNSGRVTAVVQWLDSIWKTEAQRLQG